MNGYRDRIYADYASRMQDASPEFNPAVATRWGRAYDQYFRGWLPAERNAAIVDLACGGGALLFFLKERGYQRLTGVDLSPSQINIAKQVIPNVVQASVLDFLKEHPGEFDLITGLDIIEHFHKDEVLQFLDGCFAALKPGGRLILQTPNCNSPVAARERYHDFTHEIGLTPNSLSRLLKLCGFDNPESREMGPPAGYSVLASIRFVLWQMYRLNYTLHNLIETGNPGSPVFTRVFSISALKGGSRAVLK